MATCEWMVPAGEAVGESPKVTSTKEEEPMVRTNRTFRTAFSFVSRHHILLVVVLSLLHVGLALLPHRDSGRTDCLCPA